MPSQPTKPLIGNSPDIAWLEANRAELRRRRIIASPDIFPIETQHGTVLNLRNANGRGGGSSSTAGQYILKDWSYADFLICRELTANPEWNPEEDTNRFTEGDTDIYIAKPYLLRRSEFDGLTITVPTEHLSGSVIVSADKFYKYTYYSATFRLIEQLASVGGSTLASEYQVILDRFTEDEILTAKSVNDLQMQAFEEDITLEAELPGRTWARAVSPLA